MQIRKNEMSRNKIRSTVCIVLLVLNAFVAFYLYGAPSVNRVDRFRPSYDDSSKEDYYCVLDSDTVAINDAGEEFIVKRGYQLIGEYQADGSVRIRTFDYPEGIEGCDDQYLTIKDPHYIRVSPKELLIHRDLWFFFPMVGGSFLRGLLASSVVVFIDGLYFVSCKRRGKFKTYILMNVFLLFIIFSSWSLLPKPYLYRG